MMSRDDTTRKATTAIVVSVGLFAGGDSYSHIYHLARAHHQDIMSAALVPLAGLENRVNGIGSTVTSIGSFLGPYNDQCQLLQNTTGGPASYLVPCSKQG
jgi:hypothetical protein